MTNDKPATIKYSIWDTRTSDQQPNINVKSVEAREKAPLEVKDLTDEHEEIT